MLPPQEFRSEANHGIHRRVEQNKPVKGEWGSPPEVRGGGGDQHQGRMPEVIAWPEDDPDYSPTARHDKPDECPNTNVPAHGRFPLLRLYPVLEVMHKSSDAGHPSADGRLSSSTRVICPRA